MIEVVKGGMQVLTNLTEKEMEQIKEELTLDNPAYKQVKQFSRFNYTSIPPYLTFYSSMNGSLIVPRGYRIPFQHKVIRDDRIERNVLYPKFKLELRDTQKEALAEWDKDRENGMIVLQTGKGKSILGCYLAYHTKQRTLVIVQKNDLVTSWSKDIELCFGLPKEKIGLIKAGEFRIGRQFTITTIQTLSKLDSKSQRELHEKFGMVIVDECHHSPAKSYDILKLIRAKYHIALTATDMRTDGLDRVMNWMFGEVAYRGLIDENDKDIMPYKVIIKESNIKYNPPDTYLYGNTEVDEETAEKLKMAGKKIKRKPLSIHDLRDVVQKSDSFNSIVAKDILKEYTNNKSCVAFFHTKEYVRDMRDRLLNLGVPKDQIQLFYGDSKEEESVLMSRAEDKEVLITLATYSKLGEGSNIKSFERGFLVTSLNNEVGVIQSVGRLRRTKKEKTDVIIYDYHHKDVKGMRNHIDTRLKVYKEQKAIIEGYKSSNNQKGIIFRGFKRK